MRRAGGGSIPQEPPAGESQSNGAVENGVKLLKGMIRAHVLAFERKLGVKIPTEHAAMSWIVEAVSDLVTKHLKGQDGRTGFERLYGKPAREEAFELGEVVLWRRPKKPDSNVLLESRWEEGIWLGRKWGSMVHFIGMGREVVEARAVQRKPKEERWNKDLLQNLLASPWCNPVPLEDQRVPEVLPPRGEPIPHCPERAECPRGPEAGLHQGCRPGALRVHGRLPPVQPDAGGPAGPRHSTHPGTSSKD